MDKKIAGLLGAVAGLATMNATQAATGTAANSSEALQASSYADLLAPIPNAAELLKADDSKSNGCEFIPAVFVALPVAGNCSTPRKSPLPFTSSVAAGAFLPMLTLPPSWNNAELPNAVLLVQRGMKLVLPEPLTVAPTAASEVADAADLFA